MKAFLIGLLALSALTGAGTAHAGSTSPTDAWFSSWHRADPNQTQVNLNGAIADEMARKGGYGAANVTVNNNTNIGTETINHNGPETSSGATNINNLTSTSNSVGAGSNGVTFTATTGSSQYAGQTNQGATAQATVAYPGSSVGSTSSTGNHQ